MHFHQKIEELPGEYAVHVTLGEAATNATLHASATSGAYIYTPACDLEAGGLTWMGTDADADGNTVHHTFAYSVTTNKWCEGLEGAIKVVPHGASEAQWHTASVASDSAMVLQDSHFDLRDYTATIEWKTHTREADASTDFTWDILEDWCIWDLDTDAWWTRDTLRSVWAKQSASWSSSALCGPTEVTFWHAGEEAMPANGEHAWANLTSVT